MPTIVCNAAALTVATLYYYWRSHHEAKMEFRRRLHERIAYMLWVTASTTIS